MPNLTLRPLPLPEFHLLRKPGADGAHRSREARGSLRSSDFYLESTADAVSAFGTGVAPTRFQFYFIGVVARSRAVCTTGLASFEVRPRTAFFVPPGQIHSSRGWSTRDLGYALSFSEAFFVETLADKAALRRSPLFQWDRPPHLRLSVAQDRRVREALGHLQAEWQRPQGYSPAVLRVLLHLVVALLEDAICLCLKDEAPLDANARLYQRFRAELERSFRSEKRPSGYAARLGVHPNHLATAVRSASGLPPGDWVRARLVLEAQCLLGNTTRSVKEIAAELGYDDEAYFSRVFKKAVGSSPRDYQLGAAA